VLASTFVARSIDCGHLFPPPASRTFAGASKRLGFTDAFAFFSAGASDVPVISAIAVRELGIAPAVSPALRD
jgi:hypothetical protein